MLLGAVALESLFLAVDPVAKRLVPVEGMVGATAALTSLLFEDSRRVLAELVEVAEPRVIICHTVRWSTSR